MKPQHLAFAPEARDDLVAAWHLVYLNDGEERADRLLARIEAFCRSLGEFAEIGTRRDDVRNGLRVVAIPGLSTATVVFVVQDNAVIVLGIGYLGRNVLGRFHR